MALDDLVLAVGQVAKADHERGVQQAVNMFLQAEHGRAPIGRVAANTFKHAEPILQACTHERNDTFRRRPKFAFHPYVTWGPWHSSPQFCTTASRVTVAAQAGQEEPTARKQEALFIIRRLWKPG